MHGDALRHWYPRGDSSMIDGWRTSGALLAHPSDFVVDSGSSQSASQNLARSYGRENVSSKLLGLEMGNERFPATITIRRPIDEYQESRAY